MHQRGIGARRQITESIEVKQKPVPRGWILA
jgi:hypothetical protein